MVHHRGSEDPRDSSTTSIAERVKRRARLLLTAARAGEPDALRRLRSLPELSRVETVDGPLLKLRHALAVEARALGFSGWSHLSAFLRGAELEDWGTLLYPDGAAAHWNIWSADYEEARSIRSEHGGFLFAYKRHFFIADRHFVAMLGLDPEDDDWQRIGRDWARPGDVAARTRLFASLVAQRVGDEPHDC